MSCPECEIVLAQHKVLLLRIEVLVGERDAARDTAAKYVNRAVETREVLVLADAVIDAARNGGGPRMLEAMRTYDMAKRAARHG